MRADRLVAILLLLQQRGQVTAAEVAAELEVSERTARRDLDALGMAGLPVYSVQGRGGGWRLAGGGRTDLSGLSQDEAQALFLVAGPQAGVTPELRAAIRKLVRALPEPLRDRAEAAAGSLVVDPTAWDRISPGPAPPHLGEVQQACIDRAELQLAYRDRSGAPSQRLVQPLGVAAKDGTWYLLTDTHAGRRMFRVDRIEQVVRTGAPAVVPDDFDLPSAWAAASRHIDELRAPLRVQARARPDAVALLRRVLGTRATVGEVAADGWVEVTLRGHSVRAIAAELAGFGALVEVVAPDELRAVLGAIGRELANAYGAAPAG